MLGPGQRSSQGLFLTLLPVCSPSAGPSPLKSPSSSHPNRLIGLKLLRALPFFTETQETSLPYQMTLNMSLSQTTPAEYRTEKSGEELG